MYWCCYTWRCALSSTGLGVTLSTQLPQAASPTPKARQQLYLTQTMPMVALFDGKMLPLLYFHLKCRPDEELQMAQVMLRSPDHQAACHMSLFLWQIAALGRGDDVRERRFCEMSAPARKACIGRGCMLPRLRSGLITLFLQRSTEAFQHKAPPSSQFIHCCDLIVQRVYGAEIFTS